MLPMTHFTHSPLGPLFQPTGAVSGRRSLSQVETSLFAPPAEEDQPEQELTQQFINPEPASVDETAIEDEILEAYTLRSPSCDSSEVQQAFEEVQQAFQNPQQLEQTIGSLLVQERGFSTLACISSNIIGEGQEQIQEFFNALNQAFQQIQHSNEPLSPAQSEHIAALVAEAWGLGWLDQVVRGTNIENSATAFVFSLTNAFGGKVAQETLKQAVDLEARFGCAPPLTELFNNVGNVWQQLQPMEEQQGEEQQGQEEEQFIGVQGVDIDPATGIQNNVRWIQNHRQVHACLLAAYPESDQFFQQYGFGEEEIGQEEEGGILGIGA